MFYNIRTSLSVGERRSKHATFTPSLSVAERKL